MKPPYYIGIISGTSMDGISAALACFHDERSAIIDTCQTPYPEALRNELHQLCHGTDDEIERMGKTDGHLGALFADNIAQLLKKSSVDPKQVQAIGSHGQTIRHRPDGDYPFSVQIANPNIIVARTGIPVVADLRRKDIAYGGEGAPLAPLYHAYAFGKESTRRLVVNIGGISNISVLDGKEAVHGFDCGAGNLLLDEWCSKHRSQPYDNEGQWASEGKIHPVLLKSLQSHPFLDKSQSQVLRSTGREEFNMQWLVQCLANISEEIPAVDVQRTLVEFTVMRIVEACAEYIEDANHKTDKTMYVCGGGAYNLFMMNRLAELFKPAGVSVQNTSALDVPPEWVEALAFAWLAKRHIHGEASIVPSPSGARHKCVLGCLYPP